MIIIIHNHNKVISVLDSLTKENIVNSFDSISGSLFELAALYKDRLLVWCHYELKDYINEEGIINSFHHKRIMASYNVNDSLYMPKQIGYIDASIFIKINKQVNYPTWLMSSNIGGIHAELLNTVLKDIKRLNNFDYFINSLAKTAMPQGLFCYSEPNLLLDNVKQLKTKQASIFDLFKFVKEHYKWFWVSFLLLCFLIYEKRIPLFPFIKCLMYKEKKANFNFTDIPINSSKRVVNAKEVDVIIPTIGRKQYLYDVLKDLSNQTVLPKNVIIIEQNPDKKSKTELNYLIEEAWPFNLKHQFIHQTGVCNARNLALEQAESEWVLLGDDDNRFEADLIENLFNNLDKLGVKVLTTAYLQPHEKQTYVNTAQTPIFGSGNSIVKKDLVLKINFNLSYEFGYREDSDYGMQLRHLGEDIIFIPNVLITHLKAPIGGFRIAHKNLWHNEKFQPKPSPTVMLFNQQYFTKQQNLGYKLEMFIKYYKKQSIKNPFRYIHDMKKCWNTSLYWSHIIKQKANA